MRTQKDILIIARPDHSLLIYKALQNQKVLSYQFLTFKVFPSWMKFFVNNPKAVFVNNNVLISWRWTLVNICIHKFRFAFSKRWSEEDFMSRTVSRLLLGTKYSIIYYWPYYCHTAVEHHYMQHRDVECIADVHLPNPQYVYELMKPVYQKYGIDAEMTTLHRFASETSDYLVNVPAIMAPSQYVVDTYRDTLPQKKYYVVGYGITVSNNYKKQYRNRITEFVFAGGSISLEKGCDVLCEYFRTHPEYNLHLFGSIPPEQKHIFEAYYCYDNIHFHGSVPKAVLQSVIQKYDVGIHLSRFDAYSLSVGELLGCGKPCIVSNSTGIVYDMTRFGMGIGCEIDNDSVNMAVERITQPEEYNAFVDKIDEYIRVHHKPYGEVMVDFFSSIRKGGESIL